MMKNPVMFVVEVGSVVTTLLLFTSRREFSFNLQITLWLWFTVLFANFAEAMAEVARQGASGYFACSQVRNAGQTPSSERATEDIASAKLRSGDIVIVSAGEFVPGDGEVI